MASLRFLTVVSLLLIGSCVALASWSDAVAQNEASLKELYRRRPQIKEWIITRVFGKQSSPREEPELEIDCSTCQLAVTLAFSFLEQGSEEEVENALVGLCQDLQLVDDDVCDGAVHLEFPSIYYILTHRYLTVNDVCGVLLQNLGCGEINATLTDWTITIDENKPAVVELPLVPADKPTAKVLHLTDIHPDLHYTVGSLTQCSKPLCCREGPTWDEPWNSTVEAGVFGDYMCDIPLNALEELFMDASKRYPVDEYKFVMLGGDYVHHSIWNTTKEDNLNHYKAVTDSLFKAFPNTKVYPVVGNHEPHPVNLFPPTSMWADPKFNNSWVYENLATLFESQLTPEALVTFRKAGYYTISHEPGFRLVALNTNFCYILNFWIMYESADPEGQLQWLADTLLKAEKDNEKVFILGHVPPGNVECWSVWNAQFNLIVNRFEGIIKGQFYGHTHFDDFKVFFAEDEEEVRPNNALYIGASVVSYTDLNPGYKVFHVDAADEETATWELVDHETWIYNLPEANANNEPKWFKLYGARETYGLESLRPQHLYDFVIRMAKDMTLFQKFYTHFHKDADTIEPCTDQDECRREYLCALLTSNDSDKTHCSAIDAIIPRPSSTTPASY